MHLLRFYLRRVHHRELPPPAGTLPARPHPQEPSPGPAPPAPGPALAAADPTGRHPEMTTDPAPQPAPPGQPGAARQPLAAIAASLSGHGIPARLTRLAGIPVLTVDQPGAGPDRAAVSIDPGPGGGPGPQFDCTCIWTPAPGATPQA